MQMTVRHEQFLVKEIDAMKMMEEGPPKSVCRN